MSDATSGTVRLAQALIGVDTIDPPGNEAAAAAIVAAALREAGIEPTVYEVLPGRTNLVARLPGSGERPGLALSAHFDTIGVERDRWSVDPFGGAIRDGRLYGRGATDMKAGMAAMTVAMPDLAQARTTLRGDLMLAFTAAENSSCLGARRLVEDGHFAGIGALLVSEPSGNRPLVTEKGALWLRATARGDYRHGAFTEGRTDDRGNAIIRLARFLDRAHDLDLAAPPHRHVGGPTITVGVIRGGLSTPLVPPEASADIDVRLVPGQSAESAIAAFRAIAGPHVTIDMLDLKPAVDTPDEHPFVQVCVAACRAAGAPSTPGGVAYYSDGCVIAPALGLPMVIIGPGEIGMSGAVDEYVDIAKLEAATGIFARVARDYLT